MSKEYEDWLSGKILTSCEEFECAQAFEAGQQSQQAKIDEFQRKIAFQEKAIKNIKLQFENKQIDCDRSDRKIDELQARVDTTEAWIEANKKTIALSEWHGYTTEEYVDADDLLDILKGNKDD